METMEQRVRPYLNWNVAAMSLVRLLLDSTQIKQLFSINYEVITAFNFKYEIPKISVKY